MKDHNAISLTLRKLKTTVESVKPFRGKSLFPPANTVH